MTSRGYRRQTSRLEGRQHPRLLTFKTSQPLSTRCFIIYTISSKQQVTSLELLPPPRIRHGKHNGSLRHQRHTTAETSLLLVSLSANCGLANKTLLMTFNSDIDNCLYPKSQLSQNPRRGNHTDLKTRRQSPRSHGKIDRHLLRQPPQSLR
jgi:hypothetical protein